MSLSIDIFPATPAPGSTTMPRPEAIELFLNGHCAAFAYGAWLALGKPADVGISVLIDEFGEPNFDLDEDEDPTRCAIHAYLSTSSIDFDAEGIKTPEEMADRYGLNGYDVDGPWHPDEFLKTMCDEEGPLECDPAFVELAQQIVGEMIDESPEIAAALSR